MNESEQILVDDVLAEARALGWAGRIEVQLRPGWTPQVFAVHRKLRREARPLRDETERVQQRAAVNATG